ELPLARDTALIQMRRLPAGPQRSATLLLHYSLDEKLRPARVLHWTILGITLGSLILAFVIAQVFAQRLAKPIVELVGHTRRIARGDYSIRNKSYRNDELGRLSEAFDQMASGLDERERIRVAFGKAVSPEIARQLLRDGARLGGEERQVTILFTDLRGFTSLSEKLPPQELITLLNRYLDRMVSVIDRHGGTIDKFIGDSIMALFGAPGEQPDAADRALAAALDMQRALADLNRELAAENRPPLAIGIGINTARVVAGNMGSHSRLNYTVLGDGVNVASRLQSLTRTPEYRTDLITSAATLAALKAPAAFRARSLGSVQVKGRAEPVEIFAVE
ncbi:MAG TPA: adenylate/guanylate cyclase domain-containing protein, partial [Opitutaceae bacterium]